MREKKLTKTHFKNYDHHAWGNQGHSELSDFYQYQNKDHISGLVDLSQLLHIEICNQSAPHAICIQIRTSTTWDIRHSFDSIPHRRRSSKPETCKWCVCVWTWIIFYSSGRQCCVRLCLVFVWASALQMRRCQLARRFARCARTCSCLSVRDDRECMCDVCVIRYLNVKWICISLYDAACILTHTDRVRVRANVWIATRSRCKHKLHHSPKTRGNQHSPRTDRQICPYENARHASVYTNGLARICWHLIWFRLHSHTHMNNITAFAWQTRNYAPDLQHRRLGGFACDWCAFGGVLWWKAEHKMCKRQSPLTHHHRMTH